MLFLSFSSRICFLKRSSVKFYFNSWKISCFINRSMSIYILQGHIRNVVSIKMKEKQIGTPFIKKLIHKHLMSLLVFFEIIKETWSSSKEEILIRRCFLWIALYGNPNYSLIKPSDMIMMNSGFQINS